MLENITEKCQLLFLKAEDNDTEEIIDESNINVEDSSSYIEERQDNFSRKV